MHVGWKLKLGIFHVKSDSPAERRRKRAAKRKRRDARRKRRQARRQRFRQWIERRATARWNQRVRETVIASTKPQAVRSDARARRDAGRAARVSARTASARADAERVTGSGPQARPSTAQDASYSGGFTIGPDPAGGVSAWSGRPGQSRRIGGPFRDQQEATRWVGENATAIVRAQREESWGTTPDPAGNGYGMSFADRQEKLRAAGLCGAKTQDGTPCRNGSGCPIPSHHRRVLA